MSGVNDRPGCEDCAWYQSHLARGDTPGIVASISALFDRHKRDAHAVRQQEGPDMTCPLPGCGAPIVSQHGNKRVCANSHETTAF